MTLSKDAILVAIPRETNEQVRMRSIQSTMVGHPSTMQARMAILVPPLLVEGIAHGPSGSTRLTPDPAIFSRFFSVTDAMITLADGSSEAMPVALVNRDAVAAMTLVAEVPRAEQAPAASLSSSFLQRLISNS
jgi:hypothetical protein